MGMTNEMEDPQATGTNLPLEAGSIGSDSGSAGIPSEKPPIRTEGTGKKDLNALLAKQGGTGEQRVAPSSLNRGGSSIAATGITNTGQSLDLLQGTLLEEANTENESAPTSSAGADSHSLAENSASQSIERVNQGNTWAERNVAVNERQEGLHTEKVALTSTGTTGTSGRINSDGTLNVPRMENLLYEEDASFQPLEPHETSANHAKASYERVEVSSRSTSQVDRNVAVNVQNDGTSASVHTSLSQTTTGSRTRINSDGTIHVPRMEQIGADSPMEAHRVQYETDSSVRRAAPMQETRIVNRSSGPTDSKSALRYVFQQEESSPNAPVTESILETSTIERQTNPRQKQTEDSRRPTKDSQNRNGNRK